MPKNRNDIVQSSDFEVLLDGMQSIKDLWSFSGESPRTLKPSSGNKVMTNMINSWIDILNSYARRTGYSNTNILERIEEHNLIIPTVHNTIESKIPVIKYHCNRSECNRSESNKSESDRWESNSSECDRSGESNKSFECNRGESNRGESNSSESDRGESNYDEFD